MIINSAEPEHIVYDYDFTFTSGHFIELTIDPRFDTIDFSDPTKILVTLGAKEKSGRQLPAEELEISRQHLIVKACRTRTVTDVTAEQQAEFDEFMKSLENPSKSVN